MLAAHEQHTHSAHALQKKCTLAIVSPNRDERGSVGIGRGARSLVVVAYLAPLRERWRWIMLGMVQLSVVFSGARASVREPLSNAPQAVTGSGRVQEQPENLPQAMARQ